MESSCAEKAPLPPWQADRLILLDNGSLEPASTLNLRRLAAGVSHRLKLEVNPVSLLHSNKIDPEALGGRAAVTLEPYLKESLALGLKHFALVPLFFGPSGAVLDYLPARVAHLRKTWPSWELRVAPPLLDSTESREGAILEILLDHVEGLLKTTGTPWDTDTPEQRPAVILVDHGSPKPELAAMRDHLAERLRQKLGAKVRLVQAASMERRPEADYAFNEPLLHSAFDLPGLDEGKVILAHLFLSPGRHAGPGGDIAALVKAACQRHPKLRVHPTPLVGEHPALLLHLEQRFRELLNPSQEPGPGF